MKTVEMARTENWIKLASFSGLLSLLLVELMELVEVDELVELVKAGMLQRSELQQHTVISELGNWSISCF